MLKMILYILLLLNILVVIDSLHLNNNQITMINKLIQNPKLKSQEREKINLILYKAYEKFAIKKAIDFKLLHKFKCADIPKDELVLVSKIGLFKSIKKYNGKHDIVRYSSIYINSELLRLLTEKYSLNILPKKYRSKNKKSLSEIEIIRYKNLLNINLAVLYEPWQIDLIFQHNEDILNKLHEKYEEIDRLSLLYNELSPFSKRILYSKYYLYKNKNTSNKYLADLMCCSEETIRIHLLEAKEKIHIYNENLF
jgi:RNA polymerase sigma factor (sigma-70 family)